MIPSRKDFALAKKELISRGWEEQFTITREGDRMDFGTRFDKDNIHFYLNLYTINNLPL